MLPRTLMAHLISATSRSSQIFSESAVCNRDADYSVRAQYATEMQMQQGPRSTIRTRVNMQARVLSRRRKKQKTAGKEKSVGAGCELVTWLIIDK
jgi:hypothetical protein